MMDSSALKTMRVSYCFTVISGQGIIIIKIFSRVRHFDGLRIPAFNSYYCVMSILLKYVIAYAKTNHLSGKNILNSQVGMHKERRILNMN